MRKTTAGGLAIVRIILVLILAVGIAGGIYWATRGDSLEDQVRADIERRMREAQGGFVGTMSKALMNMMGGIDGSMARMRLMGMTPLHYAASVGNVELLRNALAEGIDVNVRDRQGQTPLFHALTPRPPGPDTVGPLIDAGADVNARHNNGWTPLMAAVQYLSESGVSQLIRAGADVNLVGNMGQSAILEALDQEHDGLVMTLLEAGADVTVPKSGHRTPLLLSSVSLPEKVSLAILAAGAATGGKDYYEWTAIHHAAWEGHDNLVTALLKAGAHIDARTQDGTTALQIAAREDLWEIAELLIRAGASLAARDEKGWSAMHCAAANPEMLKHLVKAGADVDARANDGRTPLHVATKSGSIQAVKTLLSLKADVNARDKRGWSSMMLAVAQGEKLRTVLAGAGALEKSWTPLHRAAIDGNADVLRKLLAAGAKVNATDRAGRTALMLACDRTPMFSENIAALLKAKADTNVQDADGRTPLHLACYREDAKLLEHLLAAGAKTSSQDKSGRTPLHVACGRGQLSLVKQLVKVGADVNARDTNGDTPLHALFDNDGVVMGRDDFAVYLVGKGADLRAKNKSGKLVIDAITSPGGELEDLVNKARFLENEAMLDALLSGAGKAEPATQGTTPADALRRAARAVADDDRAGYLACFSGDDDELILAGEAYKSLRAALSLRKAMIAAYGLDGWYVFQDDEKFTLGLPCFLRPIDEDRLEVHGDFARYFYGSKQFPDKCPLARGADGRWRMSVTTLIGKHPDLKELAKLLGKMTQTVRGLEQKVGKEGVTPEMLEDEAMGTFFSN